QIFHELTALHGILPWSFRIFYLFTFLNALNIYQFQKDVLFDSSFVNPQWPVRILADFVSTHWIIDLSFASLVVGSLLAGFFAEIFIFRALAFLGHFYVMALVNSDGLFANHLDMQLYPLFVFLFL